MILEAGGAAELVSVDPHQIKLHSRSTFIACNDK